MADSETAANDALRLHLLVLRCQAGDEAAFAKLFAEFSGRTLRYLRGLLGDAADDVQQEVWLAVYLGLRGLTNPRAFRTWLFQTTRHRAIDHLRKKKRESELVADADVESTADAETEGIDGEMLDAGLASLPTVQREVILLRYRDDLEYAEIAIVVGCSVGTVRSRLHHAKRRLREYVEQSRTMNPDTTTRGTS